ncbi:MAG: ABC transporter permease [Minisyncoccia bacterium]
MNKFNKMIKRILISFGIGTLRNDKNIKLNEFLFKFKRNKLAIIGLSIFIFLIILSVFANFIAPYPQDAGIAVHFNQTLQPPSLKHIFGTDDLGRDIFSRVLFGARYTLIAGLSIPLIGASIGVTLGLIAGYFGKKLGTIIMRITDIFLSIPPLVIALLVISVLGPGLMNVIIALSIDWWSWYVRMVQAEVLVIREQNFVEASYLLGSSKFRIIFSHILPNAIFPIIVKITLDMGYAILNVAALGFLGLGITPPTPELGYLVAEGRLFLPNDWWISTFPGLFIFLAILSINLLGDGLRDIFDVEVT